MWSWPAKTGFLSWARAISRSVRAGRAEEAIKVYHEMQRSGVAADGYVYAVVLKACASMGALAEGRLVHADAVRKGWEQDLFVGTALIHMYAKCGRLQDARWVFEHVPAKSEVCWNAMIGGYAGNGDGEEAIALYRRMAEEEGIGPDRVTFVSLLKACSTLTALEWGKLSHGCITQYRLHTDAFVSSSLIHMYAKCCSLDDARSMFDAVCDDRNDVCWTALISGYAQAGQGEEALAVLGDMVREKGVEGGNKVTYLSSLKACSSCGCVEHGRLIHAYILARGFEADVSMGNSLIDMYCKCSMVEEGVKVFDRLWGRNCVSWNTLLAGLCAHGDVSCDVVGLYEDMVRDGIHPDKVTLTSFVKLCSSRAALEMGKLIHSSYMLDGEDMFVGNSLIGLYSKCGHVDDARRVFDRMHERDVLSWSSMIAGYGDNGYAQEALLLFEEMSSNGLLPDHIVLLIVFRAASSMAALDVARLIHRRVRVLVPGGRQLGGGKDEGLGCTLIHMYSKCGSLEEARQVFDSMASRDVLSWTAMISGYAQHGRTREALRLFEAMQAENVPPDAVTFLCLLSACAHSGLLEQGTALFHSMSAAWGVSPEMEHCAAMVDLLARAGHLQEAQQFIQQMPLPPSVDVWMSMLSACRIHNQVETGLWCFQSLLELHPRNPAAAYSLMASIYDNAGSCEDSARIKMEMHRAGFKKEAGRTWMECDGNVHSFVVDDTSHAERLQIHQMLNAITQNVHNLHIATPQCR